MLQHYFAKLQFPPKIITNSSSLKKMNEATKKRVSHRLSSLEDGTLRETSWFAIAHISHGMGSKKVWEGKKEDPLKKSTLMWEFDFSSRSFLKAMKFSCTPELPKFFKGGKESYFSLPYQPTRTVLEYPTGSTWPKRFVKDWSIPSWGTKRDPRTFAYQFASSWSSRPLEKKIRSGKTLR